MKQSRFSSKVFWITFSAQMISVIGFLGLWDAWGVLPGQVETVVSSILQILVLFGVLNNPTDKENF